MKSFDKLSNNLFSNTFFLIILRILFLTFLFTSTFYLIKINFLFGFFTYLLYSISWNFWGWAGLGHEMVHMNPFKSKKLNKFFLVICGLLSLSNWHLFSATHFSHHKDAHGVYDFESPSKFGSSFLISIKESLLNFIFDFKKLKKTFKYLYLNSFNLIPINKLDLFLRKRNKVSKVALSAQIILFYVFIIFLISIYLKNFILIFILLIPNFIGTNLVKNLARLQHPSHQVLESLGINYIQYKGRAFNLNDLDNNFIENNIDIKLPNLLTFLYSSMNFHATHHLNVNLPFYKLKNKSKENYDLGSIGFIKLSFKKLLLLNLRSF